MYVFIYLFIYLSMCIFVYLSIYLFIYLSMYICVYLSIYLFIYLCIYIYFFIGFQPSFLIFPKHFARNSTDALPMPLCRASSIARLKSTATAAGCCPRGPGGGRRRPAEAGGAPASGALERLKNGGNGGEMDEEMAKNNGKRKG